MSKPLTRERLDEIELALAQLGELQVECVYARSEEDLIGNELRQAHDGKTIADSFNADLLRIELDNDEDRSVFYDAGTLNHFNAIVTVVDSMKDAIAEIKRLRENISALVSASKEFHSAEDCQAEGRADCRMCAAIKEAEPPQETK